MSEKKIDPNELSTDVLLADILLRITALEQILIVKGIFSKEELKEMTENLVKKATKVVLDKLQTSSNLNEFIEQLGRKNDKITKN